MPKQEQPSAPRRDWTSGNDVRLLENGEAYFPAVFGAITAARREVLVETFILFEDKVGLALRDALVAAARRGAQVDVTVDGFGSADLSRGFVASLAAAGVRLHVFDPAPRRFGWRTNWLRRLHRKLVAVDGERAFVGGINYSADHLMDFGPQAKQDYAVEVRGPAVAQIQRFMHEALAAAARPPPRRRWFGRHGAPQAAGWPAVDDRGAELLLVTRDNHRHPNDIERYYLVATRAARRRIVIANAYFFPGYRLLRELRRAARRGVRVDLVLQGEPDMAIVKTAASLLYHHLIQAGVHVHEYCERPLHGKVAAVDDDWATVGSSNLDPLSLSLNLEANLVVRDQGFNAELTTRLDALIAAGCREVAAGELRESHWWRVLRSVFVFHAMRRFPTWAGWLPRHAPRLALAESLHEPVDTTRPPPDPGTAPPTAATATGPETRP